MTDEEYWEYCLEFDYDEDCSWYWDCYSIYEYAVCDENEGYYYDDWDYDYDDQDYDNDDWDYEDEDDYDYGSESWQSDYDWDSWDDDWRRLEQTIANKTSSVRDLITIEVAEK